MVISYVLVYRKFRSTNIRACFISNLPIMCDGTIVSKTLPSEIMDDIRLFREAGSVRASVHCFVYPLSRFYENLKDVFILSESSIAILRIALVHNEIVRVRYIYRKC